MKPTRVLVGVAGLATSVLVSLASSVALHTPAAHAVITTRVTAVTHPSKRSVALAYALRQRGCWYRYGGTGPCSHGYDCSGLVYKAYGSAGIHLPRTADAQRASRLTIRVSRSQARDGDLVFWGYGHVEFYYHGGRYGAHHTGTRISAESLYGSPAFYRVRGAG